MSTVIWKNFLIDKVTLSIVINPLVNKFIWSQFYGFMEFEKKLFPTGKFVFLKEPYGRRIICYPDTKNKEALVELNVMSSKGKKKYFRMTIFRGNFSRVEFSKSFSKFTEIFNALFPDVCYDVMYKSAIVTNIEFAADTVSHLKNTFLPFNKRLSTSSIYQGKDGKLGTTYLGSSKSSYFYRIYDKAQERKDKGFKPPSGAWTRIEVVLRCTGLRLWQLESKLKNPFAKLEISELVGLIATANATQALFLYWAELYGTAEAMQSLSVSERKKMLTFLRQSTAWWWKPDYLWKKVPEALAIFDPATLTVTPYDYQSKDAFG